MSNVKPLPLPPYSKRPSWIVILLSVLVVCLVTALGIFAYFEYYVPAQTEEKSSIDEQEGDTLVARVRQLIELPEEEPTIATVSDVTKLEDQEFFQQAQNGDKVLIFQKAGKAILYRPSSDKIIEVGPVNIQLPDETASASGQISLPLTVVLYNGTATVGITQIVEAEIAAIQPNVTVTERENAEGNYQETLVVDLSGQRASEAKILSELVGGVVGELPDIEASPEAQMLIIVGSDYTEVSSQ